MRRYTTRIVMGHFCELLSRPKVSLRSLILSGNNSAALREKRENNSSLFTLYSSLLTFLFLRQPVFKVFLAVMQA